MYQNCRNDIQKKKEKRKSTYFFHFKFYLQKNTKKTENENLLLFFVLFANKYKKNQKRKSTSVFCLICKKHRKIKNKNLLPFSVFHFTHRNQLSVTHYPPYVWINEVSCRAGLTHPRHTLRKPLKNSLRGRNPPEPTLNNTKIRHKNYKTRKYPKTSSLNQ